MNGGGSHYIHGTTGEEQNRLSRLNDILNARYLDELDPGPGERILDVGSGLGQLTLLMAEMAGSGGTVIGIERDERQLTRARELLRDHNGDSRPEFRRGDAMTLPLEKNEWGSFSLVHARFLLEHLPDPGRAVKGMVKAARPGGRIFLSDDDHDVFRLSPEPEGFRGLWEAYMRSYGKAGNDPLIGRRLVEILKGAGLVSVRNTAVFFGGCAGMEIFPAVADNLIGILDGARDTILASGGISESSYRSAMEELRRWKEHPVAAQWYIVHCAEGRRPE